MLQVFSKKNDKRRGLARNSNQVAKDRVQQIVKSYRLKLGSNRKPLSFAKFASELESSVRFLGLGISYQSVKNWEDGIYLPDYSFILQLSIHAPEKSWQRAFAKDILAAQWPELYAPASEIGKTVLRSK